MDVRFFASTAELGLGMGVSVVHAVIPPFIINRSSVTSMASYYYRHV